MFLGILSYALLDTTYFTASAAIEGMSNSGNITSHCCQPSGTVPKTVFRNGTYTTYF